MISGFLCFFVGVEEIAYVFAGLSSLPQHFQYMANKVQICPQFTDIVLVRMNWASIETVLHHFSLALGQAWISYL